MHLHALADVHIIAISFPFQVRYACSDITGAVRGREVRYVRWVLSVERRSRLPPCGDQAESEAYRERRTVSSIMPKIFRQ